VVIAFLSALSFGLVWLFTFFALRNDPMVFSYAQGGFPLANRLVLIYMGFAFLVSLLREVVKDIEDREGDERYGCGTLAVSKGIVAARRMGLTINVACLVFTAWTQYFFLNAGFLFLFGYFLLIDVLLVVAMIWLWQAQTKPQYHRLAKFIKLLMLIGILSMVLAGLEI
jgi:4-hydroxybenzoate polyprenyltransferase